MAPNQADYTDRYSSEQERNQNNRLEQPPIQQLFDSKYIRQPMTTFNWVIFSIYFPFGIILAFFRVLLTVIVCLYATISEKYLPWKLSDHRLFQIICYIAGVFVRSIDGKLPSKKELSHCFIVSNHTMTGDPGVLYFLYHNNAKVVHKSNVGSFDIITRHKILVGEDKVQVRQQILEEVEKDPTPVVIYPEGATTNGNVGLLRFSSFVFGLNRPIVPVGVHYEPAFSFLPFHSIKPYYTFHMFLVAFQPFIFVDCVVLPKQERFSSETPEEFASRIQKQIAHSIKLTPTNYSSNDKSNLRKNLVKPN